MKKTAILLFILVLCGCGRKEESWVHGAWVSEKLIYEDAELYEKKYANKEPVTLFIMEFTPDGDINRYSIKGKQTLGGDFRVVGDYLELGSKEKDSFLRLGEFQRPDYLLMDFKKGRVTVLKKLPDDTDISDIDMDAYPKVIIGKDSE